MFTFSFSTSFAAEPGVTQPTYTHSEAVAKAQADLIKAFTEKAQLAKAEIAKVAEYKETFTTYVAHIPAKFYTDAVDLLVADYTKYVNEATAAWLTGAGKAGTETDPEKIKTAVLKENVDSIYVLENKKVSVAGTDFGGDIKTLILKGESATAEIEKYYQMHIWASALDTMKNEAKAEIAKVDMSLYTDDVISDADYNTLTSTTLGNVYKLTWKQVAQKEVDNLIEAVNKVSINPTKDEFDATKTAIAGIWPVKAGALVEHESITDINQEKIIISYKLGKANLKTAEDLKGATVDKEADKAVKKAAIQSEAASLLKKALATYKTEYAAASSAADKKTVADNYKKAQDMINNWTTVNLFLADAGSTKTDVELTVEATPSPTLDNITADVDLAAATTRVDLYEKAKVNADAYKIAVDKDGALQYNAAVIDKNLADLKEGVYDGTVTTIEAVKNALVAGAKAGAAEVTPWLKEVAVAQINKALKSDLSKYYAPEAAKVQALYDDLLAKVNAATTEKQLETVLGTNYTVLTTGAGSYTFVTLTGIDTKTEVKDAVIALGNFSSFVDAVNKAVDYLNWNFKPYEDGYRDQIAAGDEGAAKFLAKNDVRTYTDLTAKMNLAKEYAESLPTKGDKKAAQAEFDAMIKALPNIITFAEKEQVAKAAAFADEHGLTAAKLTNAIALVQAAERKEIDKLIAAIPATIKVSDKEAVKALMAAIDAYKATDMYADTSDRDYTTQFEALRAAEKAEIEKQIALLPIDTTRAELKVVQAAVDAFVKEYKDPAYKLNGYEAVLSDVAAERLSFAEAYVAAREVRAVKSMKLRAYSKYAKKGILVKWVIEDGKKVDADGYQVFRSVKKDNNYKKLITVKGFGVKNTKNLKKGTTYYYKVRAYKRVDGKLYFSDWSNKAHRRAR